MPANIGSTVQLQTARIVPEQDATLYESHFFAFAPKYLSITSFDKSAAIAPAMKNAGTKQVSTWSERYSISVSTPASKIVSIIISNIFEPPKIKISKIS
jgi:hypothetical protein